MTEEISANRGRFSMKVNCQWQEGLAFTAQLGRHSVRMDTRPPLGQDSGPSPKQLLLAAIAGCTAMDVVSLLRKHKQPLESLTVDTEADVTSGQPAVFQEVKLRFRIVGKVDREQAISAVELSQSKYCGVSAMVSKVSPLTYVIEINEEEVYRGHANFGL